MPELVAIRPCSAPDHRGEPSRTGRARRAVRHRPQSPWRTRRDQMGSRQPLLVDREPL